MNESSAYLWKQVQNKEFDADTLTELLTAEYDVDKETAMHDVKALIKQWVDAGIVEGC